MKKILVFIIGLFLCVASLSAQDRLASALRMYDYEQAVRIIDSLIAAVAPDSVSAAANKTELADLTLKKSGCLKKLQRFDEAAEAIVPVLEYDRGNVELLAELADCKASAGDFGSALVFYSFLTTMQPRNVYFMLCSARIKYRMKAYSEALAECDKILALNTIPDVLYMAGNCYGNLGQKDSAKVCFDKILAINPLNDKAICAKANILFAEEKYDEILEMSDPYLNVFPNNQEVLLARGLALYLKKDYKKSLEAFERQMELGNNSYPVRYYAGMNNYLLKRWSKAAGEFSAAYQLDSSDVKLVCKLADAYSCIPNQDSLSLMYFDKAINMMLPDSSLMMTVYDRKASIFLKKKDFRKAIEFYKLSFDYDSSHISALSSIGLCYEKLKDYRRALTYYERYLKVGKPGSSGYKFVEEGIEYVKQELFMLEGAQ